MVEKFIAERMPTVAAIASVVAVFGQVIFVALWMAGMFDNRAVMSYELTGIKSSVATLSAKMDQMQTRMDNGPSSSQMREVDRHLSSLDGRLDANETRQRQYEQEITRLRTLYEIFEKANAANLRGAR